jgi:hypothetical protein
MKDEESKWSLRKYGASNVTLAGGNAAPSLRDGRKFQLAQSNSIGSTRKRAWRNGTQTPRFFRSQETAAEASATRSEAPGDKKTPIVSVGGKNGWRPHPRGQLRVAKNDSNHKRNLRSRQGNTLFRVDLNVWQGSWLSKGCGWV